MFCTKCGAQLQDGAKFCVKCGTKVSALNTEAEQIAQDTVTAEENKEPKKKKHTGLKVLLIIVIILALLAGGAVACWFFVIPEGTKDYVFLQKNLMDKQYESAANKFYFSDKEISKNSEEFDDYVKEYFVSGCEFVDLFRGKYLLKTKHGDITLTYDDKEKKFCGDAFTYSISVMEPKIASGPVKDPAQKYEEVTLTGFVEGDVSYEYNAILGNDASDETNMVEVTVSLKDGKLDKIVDVSAEDESIEPDEYVKAEGGKIYFTKLKVSEDYVNTIVDNYCTLINSYIPNIKSGLSQEDFEKEIEDIAVPDCYVYDYAGLTDYRYDFSSMDYESEIENTSIDDVDVFDVEDNEIIIEGDYVYSVSVYGDSQDEVHHSCLLVRPYDDYDKIVFNTDIKENLQMFNDWIDEDMEYLEAYEELMSYFNYSEEPPFEPLTITYDMTDEVVDKYIDALLDFKRTDGAEDCKFQLVNIGVQYPLMVCIVGDYHAAYSEAFLYDEKTKKVNSIGYFGEYGMFSYIPNEGIIYSSVTGMGYMKEEIVKVSDDGVESSAVFEEDSNSDPSTYYVNGEETTEKDFISQMNAIYNKYPFENIEYLYYEDGYEPDETTAREVFEESKR